MGNVVWEWYKTNLECLLVGIKGTPAGDRYNPFNCILNCIRCSLV